MQVKQTPLHIRGILDPLHAGLGLRIVADLLDWLFVLPLSAITLLLNWYDWRFAFLMIPVSFAFITWYHVYLPKRNGYTPGKLRQGIKIISLDGAPLSWKQAILRHSVPLGLLLVQGILGLWAVIQLESGAYLQASWVERNKMTQQVLGPYSYIPMLASNAWLAIDYIVLASNDRRRSIQDFIGGTVVIKMKYEVLMQAAMQPQMREEEVDLGLHILG